MAVRKEATEELNRVKRDANLWTNYYHQSILNVTDEQKWPKKYMVNLEKCLLDIYSEPTIELNAKKKTLWILPDAWSLQNRLLVIIESVELEDTSPCICIKVRLPGPVEISQTMEGVLAAKDNCFYIYGETEIDCLIKVSTLINISVCDERSTRDMLSRCEEKISRYRHSFYKSMDMPEKEMVAQYRKNRDKVIVDVSSMQPRNVQAATVQKKFSTTSAMSKHRKCSPKQATTVQLYFRSLSIVNTKPTEGK